MLSKFALLAVLAVLLVIAVADYGDSYGRRPEAIRRGRARKLRRPHYKRTHSRDRYVVVERNDKEKHGDYHGYDVDDYDYDYDGDRDYSYGYDYIIDLNSKGYKDGRNDRESTTYGNVYAKNFIYVLKDHRRNEYEGRRGGNGGRPRKRLSGRYRGLSGYGRSRRYGSGNLY